MQIVPGSISWMAAPVAASLTPRVAPLPLPDGPPGDSVSLESAPGRAQSEATPVVSGNDPVDASTLKTLLGKEFFDAGYPGNLVVTQAVAPVPAGDTVPESLQARATDAATLRDAIERSRQDPTRVQRWFALHPEVTDTAPETAFRHGVEVFHAQVNGDREGYVTSLLPSETDGRDVLGLVERLGGDEGVHSLSLCHNHPEGHPLSPSDQAFANRLAERYGILVEMKAAVRVEGQSYLFSTYGTPRDMSGLITSPDE